MMPNQAYIHFGCGLCAPITWRNFDASPTLRIQKFPLIGKLLTGKEYPLFPRNVEFGNIINGLPVKSGTCRAIYCSHVLEHLALDDFRIALDNIYVLLMENGIFRFVLPDLEYITKSYMQSDDPKAAITYMEQTILGKQHRPRSLKAILREWFGNSQHLWMWDYKSLVVELQTAGFRDIRRAQFGDSKDLRFMEVEEIGRWENNLGIECLK